MEKIELTARNEKIYLVVDQVLVSGIGLIVGLSLARILGLEKFGIYSLLWMVVLFFGGIHQALIVAPLFSQASNIRDESADAPGFLGLQFVFSAATFVLIYLAFLLVCVFPIDLFHQYTTDVPGFSLALVASLYTLNDYYRRFFIVKNFSHNSLKIDVLAYGLQPFVIYSIHTFSTISIENILMGIAACFALSSSYGYYLLDVKDVNFDIKEPSRLSWQHGKYLAGTSILQWFSGNFFILAVASLMGPIYVGAVRAVQTIFGVFGIVLLVMENKILPDAFHIYSSSGYSDLKNYLVHFAVKITCPLVLVLLFLAAYGQIILVLVFGKEYEAYGYIMNWYSVIYIPIFLGTLFRFFVRVLGKTYLILIAYIFSAIFSLLSANILILNFGLTGALSGILMTQIIAIIVYSASLFLKNK